MSASLLASRRFGAEHDPSGSGSGLGPGIERASVMLPTITCSSCAAPIPLSSLGEHVCRPPSRSTGDRAVPRPSQLSIPASSQSQAKLPSPTPSHSSQLGRLAPASSNPPRGSSSSSSSSSPASSSSSRLPPNHLNMPARANPSPLSLSINTSAPPNNFLGPGSSSSQSSRTPSPTNPFFPHPDAASQQPAPEVLGVCLASGPGSGREGPYPTDRPLPAGIRGPGIGGDSPVADGPAGMAGVGRRAFAAAAWGVRAGVAIAATQSQQSQSQSQSQTQNQNQNGGPSRPPLHSTQSAPGPQQSYPPQSQFHSQSHSHSRPTSPPLLSAYDQPIPLALSLPQAQPYAHPGSSSSSTSSNSTIRPGFPSRQSSKELPLMPRAPLAGRLRNAAGGTQTSTSASSSHDKQRQQQQYGTSEYLLEGQSLPERSSSSGSASTSTHQRSVTAPVTSSSTGSGNHRHNESMSSAGSQHQPRGNGHGGRTGSGESLSQLLRSKSGDSQNTNPSGAKLPFFEKYKQYVASNGSVNGNGNDTGSSNSQAPALGLNGSGGGSRRSSGSSHGVRDKLTASPEQVSRLRIEEEDDDEDDDECRSALPWATPDLRGSGSNKPRADSREDDATIRVNNPSSSSRERPRLHQRYHTTDSEASSSSSMSSRSGRFGAGSGPETEEVVTPSQSWEGSLIDRIGPSAGVGVTGRQIDRKFPNNSHNGGNGYEHDDRDALEQIQEDEDEGDMVVFGLMAGQQPKLRKYSKDSSTGSTVAPRPPLSTSTRALDQDVQQSTRSRTAPDLHRREPSSASSEVSSIFPSASVSTHTSVSSSSSRRQPKQCVKCQQLVGGSKRFVERDGIVLCEKDWKKMYLPQCRRCSLPIEKSAVSSSDGQLKGKWHKECFTCMKCDEPFEGDSFYVLGGKPWCQLHYHEEK